MKIDDIAKLANVSKSAVSLALNGKKGVSKATRDTILKIAQDHGYISRPIVKAEQLFQNNSKILRFVACTNAGIVTEQYESLPFFMELIRNLDKHTGDSGYSLMVSSINIEELENEINRIEQEHKSTGILLLGTNLTPEHINLVSKIQPNLVVLDTCYDHLDVNFIVMNNVQGAYKAGKHLVELGHTDIGYVESNTRMYNFNKRKEGFFQALEEHNISVADHNLFSLSPTFVTKQEELIEKISSRIDSLPSALFCECDYMAISVIKSLSALGIKVPEDISVVGFDDILEAQVITPELTTIQVKKDRIASLAVRTLINQIEENDYDQIKLMVDTELIIRDSSMCAVNKALSTLITK
ncbi:LacI family DNA-binding transcriptional regulator [Neobacillus sp. Marseille-QA0830]